ncbi:hypothetical protein QE379_000032 [Sphingomonas sp. SORGH_AS 879]|nr:hypothetical protein [Sphingomonas sp. SORGH_AS_0879]
MGGSGFAKEAYEIALLCGHRVVGYTGLTPGVINAPYWGTGDALLDHRADFDSVFIAFGAVNRSSLEVRRDAIAWVDGKGLVLETLVSPRATISMGASIAAGAFVAHGAVVSVDACHRPMRYPEYQRDRRARCDDRCRCDPRPRRVCWRGRSGRRP